MLEPPLCAHPTQQMFWERSGQEGVALLLSLLPLLFTELLPRGAALGRSDILSQFTLITASSVPVFCVNIVQCSMKAVWWEVVSQSANPP